MQVVLVRDINNNRGIVERTITKACDNKHVFDKPYEITADDIIRILDFNNMDNWILFTGWMYLYGCQRYSGSHVAQTNLSLIQKGIRRFIHNLASHKINLHVGTALHGIDTYDAWIEEIEFLGLIGGRAQLGTDLAALNKMLAKLGTILTGMAYYCRRETFGTGDPRHNKIVWEPLVCAMKTNTINYRTARKIAKSNPDANVLQNNNGTADAVDAEKPQK